MEKILFKINSIDSSLIEDTSDITIISLNTLEEIFSTPYFQRNKNSIIH